MKISKDEARILAAALDASKFEMNTLSFNVFEQLTNLQTRLEEFGKDKRRHGRTSQDDFNDCLRRFASKARFKTQPNTP